MVLAGTMNKEIVTLLNKAGGNAVGLPRRCQSVARQEGCDARRFRHRLRGGEITSVHYQIINSRSRAAGVIPCDCAHRDGPARRDVERQRGYGGGEIAALSKPSGAAS